MSDKIAQDKVGETRIETISLGFDYSLTNTPILFETNLYGGKLDLYFELYATRNDALVGHKRITELIKALNPQEQP